MEKGFGPQFTGPGNVAGEGFGPQFMGPGNVAGAGYNGFDHFGGFGGYDHCGCHGGQRSGFALIVVLFILLIIIGATVYCR